MPDHFECPEGMYPVDSDYLSEEYDSFDEFKEAAEAASDIMNLPISYFFDHDEQVFSLVFAMPRKSLGTWSLALRDFDVEQVRAWLDPWLKSQFDIWFGWKS